MASLETGTVGMAALRSGFAIKPISPSNWSVNTGISDLFFNHEPAIVIAAKIAEEDVTWEQVKAEMHLVALEFIRMLSDAGFDLSEFWTAHLVEDFFRRA